jgi:hypothetical protein
MEDKGYNLVTLHQPEQVPDLADLEVSFQRSPTRPMMEFHVRYQDGEFQLPPTLEPSRLKDARVKVVVTVGKGLHDSLSREAQDDLRGRFLAGNPSDLRLKIEHRQETGMDIAPVSLAKTAEQKLQAFQHGFSVLRGSLQGTCRLHSSANFGDDSKPQINGPDHRPQAR